MIILSAVLSPTYPSLNGEMTFFSQATRKRAGTCQIKYATGCTCRKHAATKIRGHYNLFKICLFFWYEIYVYQ